jgi:DNA polymerase-3 subunit chi
MAEVRFHHFERRKPVAALAGLLREALAQGRRAVVQFADEASLMRADEELWTLEPASFLPHGSARDGDAASHAAERPASPRRPMTPRCAFSWTASIR